MDSFPEDAANTPVNFYGSALASNEEDNEEELLHVTTEVRHFKWSFARSRAVLNLYFVTAPELFLSLLGNRK